MLAPYNRPRARVCVCLMYVLLPIVASGHLMNIQCTYNVQCTLYIVHVQYVYCILMHKTVYVYTFVYVHVHVHVHVCTSSVSRVHVHVIILCQMVDNAALPYAVEEGLEYIRFEHSEVCCGIVPGQVM